MSTKGFFKSLFDVTFSEFITTRVVKGLFIVLIAVFAIAALGTLVTSIAAGGGQAFLAIVVAPLSFILLVLLARIWLELVLVLFRIADNTEKLVKAGTSQTQSEAKEQ